MKSESNSLIPTLEREYGEAKKLWFTSKRDRMLIVIPKLARNDFASFLASKGNPTGITQLDRPPEPGELNNFGGIAVLEPNPGTGDPLRTRAVWTTQHGPTALGGLFSSQQPFLKGYETLTGVLFPRNIGYKGPVGEEIIEPWLRALSEQITICFTKVLKLGEQQHSLEKLLNLNRSRGIKLAIYGLGDIGGFVAQTLYAKNRGSSHIDELILASRSKDTVEALRIELEDIGLQRGAHPNLTSVTTENLEDIFAADIILFLASGPIPPATSSSMGVDVRAVQYAANRKILSELLENAAKANWGGNLLVASDPVEQLTMAALQGSVPYNRNNQRIAGFGAAINFGRARRQAEEMGLPPDNVRIYGAHGKSVVAIPTLGNSFNAETAEELSLRTGMRNYKVRQRSRKPWRAPASWMANALENLVAHNLTWASTFLPGNMPDDSGAFFGSQVLGDINLQMWDVGAVDKPSSQILDILEREHRYIALTSSKPELLFTDPFKGASDPCNCTHVAFHQDVFDAWKSRAEENANLISTSDLALSIRSQEITMEIERAIISVDKEGENSAKQKLLSLIGASIHRPEADIIKEKIDIISEGMLGGELFSNITYRQISEICGAIVDKVNVEVLADRSINILNDRKEPEVDVVDQSEIKTKTLFEGLKHPHVVERSQEWEKLAKLFQSGYNVSSALAKKILTLVNFGDDFTLYQISSSEAKNIESINALYQAQKNVLRMIYEKTKGYKGPEVTDAIVIGTTGAPFSRHHIGAINAGFKSIRERYDESDIEAFIALDDYSRSKAAEIVSGEIPPLALRRRIALLQTINEIKTYLVNPAIPIWFDTQNIHLLDQVRKEVSGDAKFWRLIGGDSLKNYPDSDLYRSIPHIIQVRGENRQQTDTLLNRQRFREYLQVDVGGSSSTKIREVLKTGVQPEEINDLTMAFIKHYGLFQ